MTTHDHEDRALCEQLRAAGRSHGDHTVAHEAADRIDALHAQRADLLDRLAASEARETALRSEIGIARLSLLDLQHTVQRQLRRLERLVHGGEDE